MPTVYPDFRRDGFFLYNAVELSRLFPDTYLIPDRELRYSLREGSIVKLSFRFSDPQEVEEAHETERMWVVVRERVGDHWIGELDNDPRFNKGIRAGDLLHFHSDHVIAIWQDH